LSCGAAEASLQAYVQHRGPAGDFSPSLFGLRAVHRIAQLDLRIVNLDRNDSNILVTGTAELGKGFCLTPIDHGLCLPDQVTMSTDGVAWMSWPAAQEPWHPDVRGYILSLDADADAALLQKAFGGRISEKCQILAWAATRLVQLSAQSEPAWTPFDVGTAIYRPDFDTPSALEQCILFAQRAVEVRCRGDPDATPHCHFLPAPDIGSDNTNLLHSGDSFVLGPRTPRCGPDDDGSSTVSTRGSPSASTEGECLFQHLLPAGTACSSSSDEHYATADTTPRMDGGLKVQVEIALRRLLAAGPAAAGEPYLV